MTYNNGAAGSYDVSWNNVGNFVGGKGWNPGAARVITYNGTWNGANVNSVSYQPTSFHEEEEKKDHRGEWNSSEGRRDEKRKLNELRFPNAGRRSTCPSTAGPGTP